MVFWRSENRQEKAITLYLLACKTEQAISIKVLPQSLSPYPSAFLCRIRVHQPNRYLEFLTKRVIWGIMIPLYPVVLSCFPAKTVSDAIGVIRITLFIWGNLFSSPTNIGKHRKTKTPKSMVVQRSEVYIVINECNISVY